MTQEGEQGRIEMDAVVLHPPIAGRFTCLEHPAGELAHLGDALGVDCTAVRHDGAWIRAHNGDGLANSDWYSWRQPLLAPCASTVEACRLNPVTNAPGSLGAPPASCITFRRADHVRVVYAHVQEVEVDVGDSVTAGQPVARIGNNGMAWHPHVHVGAWRAETPLQIRFDLMALGRLLYPDQSTDG
jgi:hypothetical protein